MTIREFNKLCTEAMALKYPSVPDHAVPPCKHKDNNTNALTKTIIAFLQYHGCQAERIPVEGRVIDQRETVQDVLGRSRSIGSVKRIPSSATKGSTDISSTIRGKSVKIEVKYGKDRQSDKQKEYQTAIEASEGIYLIAKTFEQITEELMKIIDNTAPTCQQTKTGR